MPSEQWDMVFAGISFAYFTEVVSMPLYKYFGLFAWVSKGEYLVVVLSIFAVISGLEYWYIRRAGKGKVTAKGLEREKGQVIPFGGIERIIRERGGFPAVVFTADGREKIHLADKELVKFTKTSLNRWEVKDDKVTISHGEEGQELQIVYAPRGKYSTNRLGALEAMFIGIFILAMGVIFVLEWDGFPVLWASIIGFSILLIQPYFRRVKVTLRGDKLLLAEGKQEKSIMCGEVASVQKGMFQTRITTKNDEELFFPQDCIFLPEIIEGSEKAG